MVRVDPGDEERNGGVTSVLVAVPPDVVRGDFGSYQGSSCTVADGLAFCATGGPAGSHSLTLTDRRGVDLTVPLPG